MKKKLSEWWEKNKYAVGFVAGTVMLGAGSCMIGMAFGEIMTDAKWNGSLLTLQKDGFLKLGKTENGVFTELSDAEATAAMKEFYSV